MKSVKDKVGEEVLWTIYDSHFEHFCSTERYDEFFKNEYLSQLNKRNYIAQHYEFQND